MENGRAGPAALRWQSKAVLLAFVPPVAVWLTLACGQAWEMHDRIVVATALISLGFAAVVFLLRAATPGAALTGALFAAALYFVTPGWRTALWPLLVLLLLTLGATKFGRRRKEALGTAEGKRGRTASQVAANLGMAAVVVIPEVGHALAGLSLDPERLMLVTMLAAMAEATADTLSSELGQILGGEPRLITSFARVPRGTDGAVTVTGTLAGVAGAAVVVATGVIVLQMHRRDGLIALGAGVVGLFADSLLGAVPERQGWFNNDAVNALSTAIAVAVAAVLCRHWPLG